MVIDSNKVHPSLELPFKTTTPTLDDLESATNLQMVNALKNGFDVNVNQRASATDLKKLLIDAFDGKEITEDTGVVKGVDKLDLQTALHGIGIKAGERLIILRFHHIGEAQPDDLHLSIPAAELLRHLFAQQLRQ